jgi:hypothetical protein
MENDEAQRLQRNSLTMARKNDVSEHQYYQINHQSFTPSYQ